jgi:hypothetical protein
MDTQTIKEIADQIVTQTILISWKTWGLQFALWIIGTFCAAFAAAYLAKRGEHKAIKADFDTLKSQLSENTKAVKTVETEIAHQDWAAREWKTLKRTKLEELIMATNDAVWETESWIHNTRTGSLKPISPHIDTMQTIALLYFQNELYNDTLILRRSIVALFTECCRTHGEITAAQKNSVKAKLIWESHQTTLSDAFSAITRNANKVRVEASVLMALTNGVKNYGAFILETEAESSPNATQ